MAQGEVLGPNRSPMTVTNVEQLAISRRFTGVLGPTMRRMMRSPGVVLDETTQAPYEHDITPKANQNWVARSGVTTIFDFPALYDPINVMVEIPTHSVRLRVSTSGNHAQLFDYVQNRARVPRLQQHRHVTGDR